MDDSLSEILEYQFKKFLPLGCSIILLLAAYIPVHIPLSKFLRPDIGIICVYFWALYRKDLFGAFSAFMLGIIADSIGATPFGLNAFIFMFVFILASTFGSCVNTKPFIVSWGGFAVISFLAFGIKWILLSIFYSRFLALGGITAGYAATVLFYPLIARLNIFVQNRFLSGEEVIYEQG